MTFIFMAKLLYKLGLITNKAVSLYTPVVQQTYNSHKLMVKVVKISLII